MKIANDGEIIVQRDCTGLFFVNDRRYADLHLVEARSLGQLVRKIQPIAHHYLLTSFRLVEMNGKLLAKGKAQHATI